ncbi:MAG: YlxR family protein, partial [Clostridia bacterium]|nr:YlxR family protein [Clostridia bacterium]
MNDKVNYRTCVCCKSLKYKYDMARIAVVDGKVSCDVSFKAGGRGMYICSLKCLEKISSSKKFSKIYNLVSDEEILKSIKEVLK